MINLDDVIARCTVIICLIAIACSMGQIYTRNSSGDEIANVNLLYGDIVHALENTMDSCILISVMLITSPAILIV